MCPFNYSVFMKDISNVSAVEYRSVKRLLLIRGFTSADILSELSLAYGSKHPPVQPFTFGSASSKEGGNQWSKTSQWLADQLRLLKKNSMSVMNNSLPREEL